MTTTVFTNARFLSMDAHDSEYDWVLVRDGRIAALGKGTPSADADDAAVVDLAGATVLPGFVEAHGHPTMEMQFLSPRTLDIRSSVRRDADEVMDVIREAVAAAEEGDWIAAFGWDPLLMPELPEISGELLTQLSPTVPLSVMHYSVHRTWTNRAGLERLGYTAETPDPPGSEFLRDAHGELTGEALEVPATVMLMGPGIHVGPEQFDDYFSTRLAEMSRVGVTTTGDLAYHPDLQDQLTQYYGNRCGPVRLRMYEMSGVREPVRNSGAGDELCRQVGVKIWKDGSPWTGNVDTSFPYRESPASRAIGVQGGHYGCSNYTKEQLWEICDRYVPEGWQIACHVQGDAAMDEVLDVFERIREKYSPEGEMPFRMEHGGAMTREQAERAHRLGVTVSFFPVHVYYYGEVLREFFGQRADAWVAAGFASECGMPFSLHNDPPVTTETPLLNIRTAVTRLTRSGAQMGPECGVSVREALRAQTIYAARQVLSAHEVGSLETGKFADFVVLGENPLEVAPEQLHEIEVRQTWLAGDKVFDAAG